MPDPQKNVFHRNVANAVSILGVLPLCILFWEFGFQYLIPLIIYNNIMDDLDGILAIKLDIKSRFGAMLDNVCDTVSHSVIVGVVGMQVFQQADNSLVGAMCLAGALLATSAIILRSVSRLDPDSPAGIGSPTNELIRHVLFIVIVSQIFVFDPAPFLIAAFCIHSVTMLVPFKMPYLIRSLTKSAGAIGLVNLALVIAWLVPYSAPAIAAAFVGTYLLSFLRGGIVRLKKTELETAAQLLHNLQPFDPAREVKGNTNEHLPLVENPFLQPGQGFVALPAGNGKGQEARSPGGDR